MTPGPGTPAAGTAARLWNVLFAPDAREDLDWLWARAHGALREKVGGLMRGGDRGVRQPTAVLHSVFRLQAQRHRGGQRPIPRRLATGPFKYARIDLGAFERGEEKISDGLAASLFHSMVINDARSYLADRPQDGPCTPLDTRIERHFARRGARGPDLDALLDRLERLDRRVYEIVFCVIALDMEFEDVGQVAGVSALEAEWRYRSALALLRKGYMGGVDG